MKVLTQNASRSWNLLKKWEAKPVFRRLIEQRSYLELAAGSCFSVFYRAVSVFQYILSQPCRTPISLNHRNNPLAFFGVETIDEC
jgi:hypothetical protein